MLRVQKKHIFIEERVTFRLINGGKLVMKLRETTADVQKKIENLSVSNVLYLYNLSLYNLSLS